MGYTRTAILMAAMTALFMGVGYLIGGSGGAVIALVVAGLMNVFAWWNSDRMVLRMHNARPAAGGDAGLVTLVADLARNANLPVPAVYVIDTDQPNAFATGRNPQNAAVAVTTGLLKRLSREEVAGVIAHELAHIKNHDTLIMTVTATFAGAISMLANFAFFFGGGDRERPMGIVGTLAMMILAPLAASIVQMAIPRSREYEADRIGAEIPAAPVVARLGAGGHPARGQPDRLPDRREEPGDGAHVHHQSAARPRGRQPVRDAPFDREPGGEA